MEYTRFAVYYLPRADLAQFGAAWLGWDVDRGVEVAQPDVPGIANATATPRKYGFHGTLKPPFRLAPGLGFDDLGHAVADLAATTAPAQADSLQVARIGRFLALVPQGDASGIARVASACVTQLDRFRAPAGQAELDRRRAAGLSDQQERMLTQWGYPYVLDEFRFHLTLTGRLDDSATLEAALAPPLPRPFALDQIALVGERPDGRFQTIRRFDLTGHDTAPVCNSAT